MLRLGLIGYPLGHSFSPAYFKDKFREEGIDGGYELFPLKSLDELDDLLRSLPDLRGFNVTVPYKREIMSRLDAIDDIAMRIGAVNTVKITRLEDGSLSLCGYNTDWRGFYDSLCEALPSREYEEMKAVVLGTGGAAHAVNFALGRLGVETVFVSRNPEKSKLHPAIGYDKVLDEVRGCKKLVINTTPIGMFPNTDDCPPFPYDCLTPEDFCYDLIYNPETTEFMRRSAAQGARTMNGLSMLHRQADEALKLYLIRN